MEATKMSLWYVASFPLDQYQAWLNAAHFGQDMARVDTSFAHLSRAFREPFARNRKKKKRVDTISYLVFRGSSANLSPTCTFLERYLSRRHLKSMPVDLDYIKPFMGFCTTLIYHVVYRQQYDVNGNIHVFAESLQSSSLRWICRETAKWLQLVKRMPRYCEGDTVLKHSHKIKLEELGRCQCLPVDLQRRFHLL